MSQITDITSSRHNDDGPLCHWWAACFQPATHVAMHPIVGPTPICAEHAPDAGVEVVEVAKWEEVENA